MTKTETLKQRDRGVAQGIHELCEALVYYESAAREKWSWLPEDVRFADALQTARDVLELGMP